TQKEEDWLNIIYLPKKAPYLNPNERKVNQQIKSNICANRFYDHKEEQETAVSEYLDKRFGRWYDDIRVMTLDLDKQDQYLRTNVIDVFGKETEPIYDYLRCHHKFSDHGLKIRKCQCKHPRNSATGAYFLLHIIDTV
ncbi:MAG: hypothetical protein WAJ93_17355, partial [Candidatus Nitrosopolaris sp.]